MDFKVPKHNTPVATLLKNYQDKKSGKVTESRREIQHRFSGMEWRHQKKILLAFINAGASDRDWASRKMLAYWDNSFIPVVKALWEQYHEKPLSWSILRYFPKEYLKQNIDRLSEGRNYYYLCQRLIDEKDFVIDRTRLYESDMIQLFRISKKPVSDEAIADVFFSMIAKICKGEYQSPRMYKWDTDLSYYSELSILSNRAVRSALFDIEYYLGRESLADQIRSWNDKVTKEVKAQMRSQGDESQEERIALIKSHYLRHLTLNVAETQNTIIHEMLSANPAVEKLMTSFALELSDPASF